MNERQYNLGGRSSGRNDRRLKILIIALIAVLIVLLLLLLTQCQHEDAAVSQTAVIQNAAEEPLTDASSGQIRIRIAPVVQVRDGTMQDLHFCNFNEDRFLRCKIKVGETYVYDSGKLEEGKTIVGDFVDMKGLEPGTNEALAEIYSYSTDPGQEEPLGQTNVQIKLVVE